MRHVATLIRFIAGYWVTSTVLVTVLYCVVPLTLGLATRAFFDAFTTGARIAPATALALVAAVQLIEVVTDFGVVNTWSGFDYKTHTLLQRNMFAGILRGFGRHGLPVTPGDAISRFRDEPRSISCGPMDALCDLIGRGIFAIVAAVVMWQIDPVLTLAAFTPVVIGATVSHALGTRSSIYGAAARESTSELTGFLGDLVGAHLAVRVAGAGPHVLARLRSVSETRRRMTLRDTVFGQAVNSMNMHLVSVAAAAVLLLGVREIRAGSFTVGDFALFVVYLDQLTYLPAEIGRLLTDLKRTRVTIARMNALMPGDPPEAVVAPAAIYLRGEPPAIPPPPPRERLDRLDVRGLTAVHAASGRGVTDISFTVERGSLTVLTGRVGAGKTTLLHALVGLLPRDAGEILWNGSRVFDPSVFFVPPQAAFTPQIPRLFSDTLRENLLLGRDAEDPELRAAVHAAVLEHDVATFDCGLDTLVGARGVKLSGGQIQRAATARMFLRTPELLVIDDVSSALDAATEAELWRRLFQRPGDVTCLAVSHSPIAIGRADQVLVLEDGRLVESPSPPDARLR